MVMSMAATGFFRFALFFSKASWASSAMYGGSTGCLARFDRKFLHINWGLTCFNQYIYIYYTLYIYINTSYKYYPTNIFWDHFGKPAGLVAIYIYIYISIVCSKWCGIFLLHAHLYTSCMSCSLYTVSRGGSVCMCVCNVHSSLQLNTYYMYMISEFSTMNVYFIIIP